MNGINYSSLLNNTGLFSNQTNKDEANVTGFSGVNRRAARKAAKSKSDDTKQTNVDKDTYEYSGQVRNVKAGYSKPKTESGYKALNSEGIQEGIELSDAAKNLLSELREKYGNMDFSVAEWSTDEEQDYYASLSSKDFSVLINPELLEKMASDPSAREEYESIISGAGGKLDTLKEELGEDADKVTGFSVTLDKDGNATYAVKILKDMAENSSKANKKEQERIEEKRAEKKKTEKEREEKVTRKRQETEKVTASSMEELVKAIREKLHPEQAQADTSQNEENK